MEIFKRTLMRCRICKKEVEKNGFLYKCINSNGIHAFWHRSVLSENLSDENILRMFWRMQIFQKGKEVMEVITFM